jgi:hypothetical protein
LLLFHPLRSGSSFSDALDLDLCACPCRLTRRPPRHLPRSSLLAPLSLRHQLRYLHRAVIAPPSVIATATTLHPHPHPHPHRSLPLSLSTSPHIVTAIMRRSSSISSISSLSSDADTMQIFVKDVSGTSSKPPAQARHTTRPLTCPSNPSLNTHKHIDKHSALAAGAADRPAPARRPAHSTRRQASLEQHHIARRLRHCPQRHPAHGAADARRHAPQEDPLLI